MFYYYTVYKVTNKVNGKIYIGTHKTRNLDDNYMGSGKYLKRSIEKYGLENFEKEILFVYDNPEDMFAKEGEIVNEDFLAEENTYNLKVGGFGGWDYVNDKWNDPEFYNKMSKMRKEITKELWNDSEYRNKVLKILKEKQSDPLFGQKISKNRKSNYDGFKGKKHSEETKRKISKINSVKQKGNNNSQYGTMWITNGTINKKIKKEEELIPEGFRKGKVQKI